HIDPYLARGERPPHVPRDVDREIDQALRSNQFVILAGPSKAGKSRSAFEGLVRHSPNASMVVPLAPHRISDVFDRYSSLDNRPTSAVLWLDDLERFLSTGRLIASSIRTANQQLGMQIVATIRNVELSQILQMSDSLGRDAQAVIDQATIVQIPDRMSAAE